LGSLKYWSIKELKKYLNKEIPHCVRNDTFPLEIGMGDWAALPPSHPYLQTQSIVIPNEAQRNEESHFQCNNFQKTIEKHQLISDFLPQKICTFVIANLNPFSIEIKIQNPKGFNPCDSFKLILCDPTDSTGSNIGQIAR
jgi:hypothetical protein